MFLTYQHRLAFEMQCTAQSWPDVHMRGVKARVQRCVAAGGRESDPSLSLIHAINIASIVLCPAVKGGPFWPHRCLILPPWHPTDPPVIRVEN